MLKLNNQPNLGWKSDGDFWWRNQSFLLDFAPRHKLTNYKAVRKRLWGPDRWELFEGTKAMACWVCMAAHGGHPIHTCWMEMNKWACSSKEKFSPKQVWVSRTEPTHLLWEGQNRSLARDLVLIKVKNQASPSFFRNQCCVWSVGFCPWAPQRKGLLTCKWSHHFHTFFWHLCSPGKAAQACGGHPPAQITRPAPAAWDGPPGQRRCPGMEAQPWWAAWATADCRRVRTFISDLKHDHRRDWVRLTLAPSGICLKLLDIAQRLPEALGPDTENKVITSHHSHPPCEMVLMLLKGSFHIF